MVFDLHYFFSVFPGLILKVPYTIYLGTVAFMLAMVLGGALTACKRSRLWLVRKMAGVYISFFRSTPYITQLFLFYYGLPQVIVAMRDISSEAALIITIAMNSAAFLSENIRGALLSVDKGQIEAAASIGMSRWQTAKNIVLPQAFVTAIPTLGNGYVSMIKSTAMGFTIGVVELLSRAKLGSTLSYCYLESYVAVGFVYWGIVLVIDYLQGKLEKRASRFI